MPNAISASEGYYQDRLAEDRGFQSILRAQMIKVALNVKAEALNTLQHVLRSNYANSVMNNPDEYVRRAAGIVVGMGALLGKTTITDNTAVTAATEGDIFSMLTANWTILAGGDTGS